MLASTRRTPHYHLIVRWGICPLRATSCASFRRQPTKLDPVGTSALRITCVAVATLKGVSPDARLSSPVIPQFVKSCAGQVYAAALIEGLLWLHPRGKLTG